jgi:hypothetical protein
MEQVLTESLQEVVNRDPLYFQYPILSSSYEEFTYLRDAAWARSGCIPPPAPCSSHPEFTVWLLQQQKLFESTTKGFDNRLRDRKLVLEMFPGVHEKGDPDQLLRCGPKIFAKGYCRIVFGDHGPYFELLPFQVDWTFFRDHLLKGPQRHYHEHWMTVCENDSVTDKESNKLKLYDQFRGVDDEPNPPSGPSSANNNRPEGYADYRPGRLYVSCFEVTAVETSTNSASSPNLPVNRSQRIILAFGALVLAAVVLSKLLRGPNSGR